MKKKAIILLALAGCRTPAELGPRLPPIRSSNELVEHLASRADVKDLYLRGRMTYSGPVGPRRRRLHLAVEIALGSQGNARLKASIPGINKKVGDVLIAENELWAHYLLGKKLYHGKIEGVFPEGKGRPGLPPGVGGRWFFFPDLSRASEEEMTVSHGEKYYDVTVTRKGSPARSFKLSKWSRIPEELHVFDLDKPGKVLAHVRYTSFGLEGNKLTLRALEVRLPGLDARASIKIEKLRTRAGFKPPVWRKPRVPKGTEVIELKPAGKEK